MKPAPGPKSTTVQVEHLHLGFGAKMGLHVIRVVGGLGVGRLGGLILGGRELKRRMGMVSGLRRGMRSELLLRRGGRGGEKRVRGGDEGMNGRWRPFHG